MAIHPFLTARLIPSGTGERQGSGATRDRSPAVRSPSVASVKVAPPGGSGGDHPF
jgi:hypothetical protein